MSDRTMRRATRYARSKSYRRQYDESRQKGATIFIAALYAYASSRSLDWPFTASLRGLYDRLREFV